MKKTRDIVKLRRWCIRRRGAGVPVNMICTSAQIPRITFYNWWSRYRLGGLEGLEPRSRQPHTVHRIPPENVERILRLRREKGWCPILIEGYLRRVESIEIGHTTIHRLLKQAGLNNPLPKPRQQRSYKTLAAEASEQPMAMRPQGRRRQMAHHNPRRSQPQASNTRIGRVKQKNLARDPRVAISIADQSNSYDKVVIRGHVVSQTTEGADEHIDKLAKKYTGEDFASLRTPGEKRIIIKVKPKYISD